jgi:hypothetical protein
VDYMKRAANKEIGVGKNLKREKMVRSKLTPDLKKKMWQDVERQLELYVANRPKPLKCAFNEAHPDRDCRVSHYVMYFDELCEEFLKENAYEEEAWANFHMIVARLRILCSGCHQLMVPKAGKVQEAPKEYKKRIDDILLPYKDEKKVLAHKWLDLASWGEANEKGNYTRRLGPTFFTLYQKRDSWYYVYDGKFSQISFKKPQDALVETYRLYGDIIRRYI